MRRKSCAQWKRRAASVALLLCIGLVARGTALGAQDVDPTSFFEAGRRMAAMGDASGALDAWSEGWDELAAMGLHDPRIGPAFMRTALQAGDSVRLPEASEILLWGLASPLVEGGRSALQEELERNLLILDGDEAAWYESLSDSSDARLAVELKRFWIERDPTPGSPENERLVEHWERIVEAQSKYVYNRRSPIGTDDRGVIFLKFGKPGRVQRGSLGASEAELLIRVPRDREARTRLRQYDTNPQYEAWIYDSLNDGGFTFFLFGNTDGTGPFELVEGVHELIPPAARSRSSARFTPGGIPASYYLELFYYRDLSNLGGHWGRRFSELDQLWNEYTYRANAYVSASRLAPSESEIEAYTYRYRQEDEFFPPNPPTEPVLSSFEGRERDELSAQLIRLLSDDDVPVLAVVGASAPRIGADRRAFYRGELDVPGWVMRHTLIIRDELLNEVGRLVQPLSSGQADLSNFVVRHVQEPVHLTLTARTFVRSEESDTLVMTDRLPGQAHFVPGTPLQADPDAFQLSDILTGTMVPPEIDASGLPYPLLPARQIWIQDPLRIYLEFYHMGQGPGGRALLDTQVRLRRLTDDGEVDEDQEALTLEVELTPVASRPYREAFDMQLRDQEPGRYLLEVEVTDRVRDQRVLRSASLELVR